MKWETTAGTNQVLSYSGFYVSYRYQTTPDSLVDAFRRFGETFGLHTPNYETALVTREDGKYIYRILNGDWREQYETIGDDLAKCLEFYESKKAEFGCDWSTA